LESREGDEKCVWLHAASVGEIQGIKNLVPELKRRFPKLDVFLSVNTRAGYNIAQKLFQDVFIFYLPLDIRIITQRVIRRIRPNVLVLVEQELWPNLIKSASSEGVPVVVVNGRLTEKSEKKYLRYKWLLRGAVKLISCVSVQDKVFAQRFAKIGVSRERILVTGNMKYDITSAYENKCSEAEDYYRKILNITGDEIVLVAGSTHPSEENFLLNVYEKLINKGNKLRLIIVPRHLERVRDIENQISRKGFTSSRWSDLRNRALPLLHKDFVLLVDTMGELAKFYAIASVVFVGGTIASKGGHNLVEPLMARKYIVFGKSLYNIEPLSNKLINAGLADVVLSEDDMASKVVALSEKNDILTRADKILAEVKKEGREAIVSNADILEDILRREKL